MALIKALPLVFAVIVDFEYKRLLLSCSYIYYFTIFFWLSRVLIYCGITLIHLINTKHTTFYKKKVTRSNYATLLKFTNTFSLKKSFLKLVVVKCL